MMLLRLAQDLPGFLRTPISVEQAEAILKHRLETRSERFLEMAQSTIYSHPRSPYLKLLRAAGCELSDLQRLVAVDGLEGALARLVGAGVYLTQDELKGQREVIRGSQRFMFADQDFDNPRLRQHFSRTTGGTRSATTLKKNLDGKVDSALQLAVAFDVHGISEVDHVVWRTSPGVILRLAKVGQPPIAWFYPVGPLPFRILAAGWCLAIVSRVLGCPLPGPLFLDLQDSGRMVAWLRNRLGRGRRVCLRTRPSSAVRLAATAKRMGVSLNNLWFVLGGEPYTEAQKVLVEASGARVMVRYMFGEAGTVGFGCAIPRAPDDIHVQNDSLALVVRPRSLDGLGITVNALMFSSLRASNSKVLLNVESGDYGVLERRSCGCRYEALGLQDHVSQIRSFEKMTTEGMTFVKTRLEQVLQEVLPAQFGGSSADYQVLEQEADGIRRLYLLVTPTLGEIDEGHVKRVFLAELASDGELEGYMARMWERADSIEVRRQTPIATRAGKVFPFQLVKDSALLAVVAEP
jgi:hypothetical protein